MKVCRKCSTELICPENWYKSCKDHGSYICKKCQNRITTENGKKIEHIQKKVEERKNNKIKIINFYGGKCDCCGISKIEFLSIDHINNDGAAHRKKIGITAGSHFYKWIIKNNFPPQFRVLCYNCNCCLGHNGYCPHKENKDRSIKTSNIIYYIGECRICGDLLNDNNRYSFHKRDNKNICKKCCLEIESNRVFSIKSKIVENYGSTCVECGEKTIEFLSLDHINDNGAEHRKKLNKKGISFYRWVIKNNYPNDLQLLCYNCNSYKEYYIRRNINNEVLK